MRLTSILRLSAAVLLCGGLWLAQTQQQQAPPQLKLNKITNDLYEIENDGGNVTVLLTDEGVVLVDDKFERDHDQITSLVKSVSDKPIKYVINTHHHGDHTGGNPKLAAMGVQFVSSEETRENMVEGNMKGLPNVAFEHHAHIYLGGKNVEIYHFGRAHTNGDSVVLFPAQRVLAGGDMITLGNAAPELIDYAGGGSAKEWPKSLQEVLKLDFDIVVPGHGDISKKADVAALRNSTISLMNRVHEMNVQKKSKDDISKMLQTDFHWAQLHLARGLDGVIAEMQ
jgi:cyclase